MKRERHVIGGGVDRNMRRPITKFRFGALRMRGAKLRPVAAAHRIARGRSQLHVQDVEHYLRAQMRKSVKKFHDFLRLHDGSYA